MEKPLWEKALEALGFNLTRFRWKRHARQVQLEKQERAKENEGRALRYQHKVCPSCGLTVDRDEKRCPRCEKPLASAAVTRARRYLRHFLPEGSYSYSTAFVAVNVAIFLAMGLQTAGGPEGILSGPSGRVAVQFGAWAIPLLLDGQWWRLITPIFIHFGLLHIIFNCLWLIQLGPVLEQSFGRSRFLLLYLVSGVGGFVVSIGYRILTRQVFSGIGGGASGVVFGLIAAALVLAFVRKTPGSSYFREGLLKWALFGLVISLIPGIDMAAHLGGAIFGGLLALVLGTEDQSRGHRAPDWVWLVIELACVVLVIGSFVLTALNMPVVAGS